MTIAGQPEFKPSCSEAILYALTDRLTGQGYVWHRETRGREPIKHPEAKGYLT